jgi:hypothetical protein
VSWHDCQGPRGQCGCNAVTPAFYDTKVIEARTPAHRPEAPEDRLNRFTVKQLAEIMREQRVRGTGYQTPKQEKVSRLSEALDPDALAEYEDRYGIR